MSTVCIPSSMGLIKALKTNTEEAQAQPQQEDKVLLIESEQQQEPAQSENTEQVKTESQETQEEENKDQPQSENTEQVKSETQETQEIQGEAKETQKETKETQGETKEGENDDPYQSPPRSPWSARRRKKSDDEKGMDVETPPEPSTPVETKTEPEPPEADQMEEDQKEDIEVKQQEEEGEEKVTTVPIAPAAEQKPAVVIPESQILSAPPPVSSQLFQEKPITFDDDKIKTAYSVLIQIRNHKFAWPFQEPVDPIKLNIPDYLTIVKTPMDFDTVQKKIEDGKIKTLEEYVEHVLLVFKNAMTYNPSWHEIHILAKALQKIFKKKLKATLKRVGFSGEIRQLEEKLESKKETQEGVDAAELKKRLRKSKSPKAVSDDYFSDEEEIKPKKKMKFSPTPKKKKGGRAPPPRRSVESTPIYEKSKPLPPPPPSYLPPIMPYYSGYSYAMSEEDRKREEDMRRKEQELRQREEETRRKEDELRRLELEMEMRRKEAELKLKADMLLQKELDLKAKEQALMKASKHTAAPPPKQPKKRTVKRPQYLEDEYFDSEEDEDEFRPKRKRQTQQRYSPPLRSRDRIPEGEVIKHEPDPSLDRHNDAVDHKKLKVADNIDEKMKECYEVLQTVTNQRNAAPFLHPVDPVALGIPDYFTVIKHPMDFSTIQRLLEEGVINTVDDFVEHMNLVFTNAMTYNPPSHNINTMARNLQNFFYKRLNMLYKNQQKELERMSVDDPKRAILEQANSELKSALQSMNSIEVHKPEKPAVTSPPPTANASAAEKKRAAPKPKKSKPKDEDDEEEPTPSIFQEMSYKEKLKLTNNLSSLGPEDLVRVIDVIRENMPQLANSEGEIEIDIDALDTKTQRKLEAFIKQVKAKQSRQKWKEKQKQNKARYEDMKKKLIESGQAQTETKEGEESSSESDGEGYSSDSGSGSSSSSSESESEETGAATKQSITDNNNATPPPVAPSNSPPAATSTPAATTTSPPPQAQPEPLPLPIASTETTSQ